MSIVGRGRIVALVALLGASACGGGDSTGILQGIASVLISPKSASVGVGATRGFSATAQDASGQPVSGVDVAWSSSNTGIATVNASGVAQGLKPGTVSITASAGGKSASATLTVQSTSVSGDVVSVDPSTKYQVMTGWEATAQSGQEDPSFGAYKNELFDRAVNELGINRVRLAVRAGAENTQDYYTEWRNGQIDNATWSCERYSTVNDNSDPNTINASGFHFSELDFAVDNVVLPLRQRLQANGEKLYINLNYTAFGPCSGYPYIHTDPAEYAEFVLAAFQHLDQKYGFVPDALEMILEPDNHTQWTGGAMIAKAMVAAAARLKAAGYTPDFIAPSTANMSAASTYFDQMMTVSGAPQVISTLSYHRYAGVSTSALQAIASRASQHGIRTAMLEHIASDYQDLYADLTTGMNSSWQQYTLAFPNTPDNGGKYYWIDSNNKVQIGSRTRYLRQYFRWVRFGAQRIGASASNGTLGPVAFINKNGKYVVVVKTGGAASFSVTGLPAGTYGINYTTAAAFDVSAADATIAAGAPVAVSIPAAGVVTIYGK